MHIDDETVQAGCMFVGFIAGVLLTSGIAIGIYFGARMF